MAKAKINTKLIVIIVIVLAAIAVVGSILNQPDNDFRAGTLTITYQDQTLHTFTMEELQALEPTTVEKTVVSSSRGNETGQFTGVWLATVIAAVDHNYLNGEYDFVTRATDGYASVLSAEDVLEPENVLLVYAKDGESLGTYEDGGSGPFRILIMQDHFGNRSARFLQEIEIQD